MKLAIILGTRPEIIKMAPVIRECERKNLDYFVLHTGQHYSYNLDKIFFEELELPEVKYNINVGSGSHAEETGRMMHGIEKILLRDHVDVILVQGDTNTVLAGALTASKLHIKVGHVEAGLRSHDRTMPEEINRILTDHISDYAFAPTEIAKNNLEKEGIDANRIFITGNTIVDSINQNLIIAQKKSRILKKLGLSPLNYFLATSHRQENVDNKNKLSEILSALEKVGIEFGLNIIYPVHPRTKKMVTAFGLEFPANIRVIDPIGFLDFLNLEANARMVFTDSGGIQEESCILNVPCITLRENTERPETITVGCNILSGTNPEKIFNSARTMMERQNIWENPFGDGRSSEKIIKIIN